MSILRCRQCVLAAVFIAIAEAAWPQGSTSASTPALSVGQIVEQMQLHDQARNRELLSYHSLRHYAVEYRGFFTDVAATMDVEVNYDKASGKHLQIVFQSGSGFLIDKVLKHAVDSEIEASRNKALTALTPANYRFNLLGSEIVGDRPSYVLDVEPLHESKFLYRGKIWVDVAEFAVTRMDTQPSKSPSFWISRTLIQCKYAKTSDFWLPQELRSETSVRLGGHAVLTIDYGQYQITRNPLQNLQLNR